MDAVKPELIWVEGRCYRFLEGSANTLNMTPYIEDDDQLDYEEEETHDTEIEIVPYGASKFKHTFSVPKQFFPHIIGAKHAVRQKLENDTKTSIQIPRMGQDGDITITGSDRKGIISARNRIDLLVEASRDKVKGTHFLSIPLNEGHVIMKFNSFKNDVLQNFGETARGVDNIIFQTASKLHLTIGMLHLFDDADKQRAVEALDYCKETIINPIIEQHGQINIRLQGIKIMNNDSANATVLYATVANAEEALQELADRIANHYTDIGLLKKERDQIKLHVTLMNTKFQMKNEEHSKRYKSKKITFDATEILKAHEDTFFGEVTLKQIHISELGTIGDNGYYQATGKINVTGKD